MYDIDVNNIMEINLINLRKLYTSMTYSQNWTKKRNLVTIKGATEPTIDQIICFLEDKVPNINERKIVQSFYLSKMIVSLEI